MFSTNVETRLLLKIFILNDFILVIFIIASPMYHLKFLAKIDSSVNTSDFFVLQP